MLCGRRVVIFVCASNRHYTGPTNSLRIQLINQGITLSIASDLTYLRYNFRHLFAGTNIIDAIIFHSLDGGLSATTAVEVVADLAFEGKLAVSSISPEYQKLMGLKRMLRINHSVSYGDFEEPFIDLGSFIKAIVNLCHTPDDDNDDYENARRQALAAIANHNYQVQFKEISLPNDKPRDDEICPQPERTDGKAGEVSFFFGK